MRNDLRFRVSRFPLSPYREHEHCVELWYVSVQRDIAATPAADDKLPQISADTPPDQRIALEHVQRLDDVFDSGACIGNLMLQQVFQDPVEVITDLASKLDARHDQRDSARGFGRATFLPVRRRSR
jgi:hypothetical protein